MKHTIEEPEVRNYLAALEARLAHLPTGTDSSISASSGLPRLVVVGGIDRCPFAVRCDPYRLWLADRSHRPMDGHPMESMGKDRWHAAVSRRARGRIFLPEPRSLGKLKHPCGS